MGKRTQGGCKFLKKEILTANIANDSNKCGCPKQLVRIAEKMNT